MDPFQFYETLAALQYSLKSSFFFFFPSLTHDNLLSFNLFLKRKEKKITKKKKDFCRLCKHVFPVRARPLCVCLMNVICKCLKKRR